MEDIQKGKNSIKYLYDRIHTYEEHFKYLQEVKGDERAIDYIQLKMKYDYLEEKYEKLGKSYETLLAELQK